MDKRFPSDFVFGTSISAFQTEMGTSKRSRFPGTDWYVWANDPDLKKNGLVSGNKPQNGDGFWDRYLEDFHNAEKLGTNAIRMSIEWGRLFPTDTFGIEAEFRRNEKGEPIDFSLTRNNLDNLIAISDNEAVDHYLEMFKAARKAGLKVFLTLYHWPLPVWLHDPIRSHKDISKSSKKGWLDIRTIEEFAKFSAFAREKFDDCTFSWETINEPEVIATNGYLFGDTSGFPPGLSSIPLTFQVERNLALAHNLAYRELKKGGREVGIGTAPPYFEAGNDDPKTIEVKEMARYISNEWILNAAVLGKFDNDLDGTAEEIMEGFGGADYIGIDYYMRLVVKHSENQLYGGALPLEFERCRDCSDFGWDIYPDGIREVSKWIYEKYRRPIYILENGIADSRDRKRGKYITSHLSSLSDAINVDNIPVKGYFHWSLIDNFEWAKGYSMRFGLYKVNYKTKVRTMRDSASIYARICREKGL